MHLEKNMEESSSNLIVFFKDITGEFSFWYFIVSYWMFIMSLSLIWKGENLNVSPSKCLTYILVECLTNVG